MSASHTQGGSHGSLRSYQVGFLLSILLTLASFGVAMSGAVPTQWALGGVIALCVVQLLVQLVFFLHLGTSPGQRENLSAILFTGLIIAIIVGGSAWVLHNMNENMMPPMQMMPDRNQG
jgi:cytochrome o ubiquinol oxidase operon protein cyoD